MERVIDYQVVEAPTAEELQDAVRKLLTDGWRPQGGVWHTDADWVYLQAMVKVESGPRLTPGMMQSMHAPVPVVLERPVPLTID